MSTEPRTMPGWLKWTLRAFGGLLSLTALAYLVWLGFIGWVIWKAGHPAGKPPSPHALMDMMAAFAGRTMGDLVGLFLGVRLMMVGGPKKPKPTETDIALGKAIEAAKSKTAPHRAVAKKRWQSCNLLQLGAEARRLWTFNTGKSGFTLQQEQTILAGQPLPPNVVGRDWKALFQPKLNIAWLPVEQVFLRVTQLPAGEFEETLAMVELQLEKLSPLPVTQIVWGVQILPHQVDNLQTVIVIIMARDLVEKFMGDLEGQGFLAERLELPILDELQATPITADGAYIYSDNATGKLTALVAWWQGGALRSLGLLHVPSAAGNETILKEQLSHMAWSGELEGWLQGPPSWHLVADEAAAEIWQPIFNAWLGHPVDLIVPQAESQLATLSANRSARAEPRAGLMPPEYPERYLQEFHDRLWMRGVGVVVVVYILGVVGYLATSSVQGFRADSAEQEMGGMARTYTNTLQLKAQLEVLQNRQALKFASLDCWKTTAELLPENITVQTLEFKDGKHLNLSGVAPSDAGGQLTDFNDALRKSTHDGQPLFEKLDIPVVKLDPSKSTISWSFGGDLAHAEESK